MQAGDVPGAAIVESGLAYSARLFGPFVLLARDGTDVTPSGRKARALAAYLLLAGGPVRRERLAGLLWGDRAEEQARSSLRQAIYELRSVATADTSLLAASRSQLSIDRTAVLTDLDEIEAACRAGDAAAALVLIGPRPSELLADLDGIDPAFDEWLAVERSHRGERRRRHVLDLAGRCLDEGDAASAAELALALLAADGLDEAAVRIALEASRRSGDRDMARRVYAQHEEALRRELGAAPPDDLAALYRSPPAATLTDAGAQPASNGEAEGRVPVPVEVPAFSKGNRHRLWASLAIVVVLLAAAIAVSMSRTPSPSTRIQVMALQPAGGTAATAFARALQDNAADVLNQSGVETVDGAGKGFLFWKQKPDLALKGSVVENGGRLEVHLFLEHAGSKLTLWSQRFERAAQASDLLADEAAAAATDAVYTILEARQQKGFDLDPETLALLIRGTQYVEDPRLRREGAPRDIFSQVVARVPGFASGHGMLAMALVNEARIGMPAQRPALFDRARREAETAIRIDPYASGAAYDALYYIERTNQPRRVLPADNQLAVGLRMAPDFPFLSMRECRVLVETGRARDAMPFCQRALALRPVAGPIGYTYAHVLSVAGAQRSAQDAMERAARYNPDHSMTRRVRFELAAFGGSPERALALLDES